MLSTLRNRLVRRDARTFIRIAGLLVITGVFSAVAFHVALGRWAVELALIVLVGLGILRLWMSAPPASRGR